MDIIETYHISLMLTTLSKIIKTDDIEEIFAILKEDCGVKSAKIVETVEENANTLQFDLKIEGVTFSHLVLEIENPKESNSPLLTTSESNSDKLKFFKVLSEIIAEKIKHKEFNEIMSQQINTLQEGILQQDNAKKLKDNFFANVTHELRTPLNAIIGYSELLARGIAGEVNDKTKEYLLEIQTSGLNLLNMINDILDFSKISSGQNTLNVSEFDMQRLFFEVSTTVAPLLEKKDLKLIQSINNFTLKADYRKTTQIIINLLSNAIKYSPNSDVIEISSLISDNYKIIEIKDNGIGIPKKSQKKIFKEYTQASNNNSRENSTGLGLAIVKKFCDMHNWKIELKSEENKGSTFRILINN